jgi:hypothetical protein
MFAAKQKKTAISIIPSAISDDALLDSCKQTIKYFTEGAEPVSGMARERFIQIMIIPRMIKT